ncbi:MAG: hypothetical protein HZB10_03655 [Candidatus Yonathbacteria bacterium]|nr:hypothetical protein [Candidatus Yonathbacteria bacterium]
MQIITVAPIVRGALQSELTYFSKDTIDVGMVVAAPIRTREVPAIVLGCREASKEKSSLKSSDFAIRKIAQAKPRKIWLPAFIEAAEETANFHAQKLGGTILALTPKVILDSHLEGIIREPEIVKGGNRFEALAIQGSTTERIEAYRRLVRESFARQESVFICVPAEGDVSRISLDLGRGIEEYTFALHSGVTKKRVLDACSRISKERHAVLVIGTAQYLAFPRFFKTIVIDEEHSHVWKMFTRPLLDLRIFLEAYARASKSTLILGSNILRAETHEQINRGAIGEFGRIALRAREETSTLLVDPRKEEKAIRENTGRKEFILITSELQELLNTALVRREHVLLLSARKGLAPVTTCGDCGALVRCNECGTPLVIHRKEAGTNVSQIFVCHGCGFMRVPENNAHETCPNCGGWKLQGVGIGTDRIDDEIAKLFPDTPRFILDSDRAKTRTQARKIVERFKKSQGGILIATPMALQFFDTVENTAIISIDSLFAIPDIRMPERIFALVLAMREKTTGAILIQTRADDTSLFKQALSGNLVDFTKNELAIRKTFAYPPFGTIIKVTIRGKHDEVKTEMERLKAFLKDYSPIVPGSTTKEPKNIFCMHMILKLKEGVWPDSALLQKLRALPPQFTIEVNPDHLL